MRVRGERDDRRSPDRIRDRRRGRADELRFLLKLEPLVRRLRLEILDPQLADATRGLDEVGVDAIRESWEDGVRRSDELLDDPAAELEVPTAERLLRLDTVRLEPVRVEMIRVDVDDPPDVAATRLDHL